jgi:hypothetical protein
MENQRSALSHFRPKVEKEHSSTQATIYINLSIHINKFCKREIYHNHYTLSGYHSKELSSDFRNVCFVVGHEHTVFLGFEVFTAVVMRSTIFWDITPCSPLSVNRRFGGAYCLHLQGRRNKFSKKPAIKQVASLRLTLNRLHGVISQKVILFKQSLFQSVVSNPWVLTVWCGYVKCSNLYTRKCDGLQLNICERYSW